MNDNNSVITTDELSKRIWDLISHYRKPERNTISISYLILLIKYLNDNSGRFEFPLVPKFVLPEALIWKELFGKNYRNIIEDAISEIAKQPDADLFLELFEDMRYFLKDDPLPHNFQDDLLSIFYLINFEGAKINVLSDVYFHLIKKLSETSSTGQGLYLPSSVEDLLIDLLDAKSNSSIYDPYCNSGNLLIKSYEWVLEGVDDNPNVELFGEVRNPFQRFNVLINFISSGITKGTIEKGSSLFSPSFTKDNQIKQFDFVISIPPIGERIDTYLYEKLLDDKFARFKYSLSPHYTEFAYIQHTLASLNTTGRAVLLVNPRVLFVKREEGEIRKSLLEEDFIEAVISLPRGLLQEISIPLCIITLNKSKTRELQDKVIFISGEKDLITNGQYNDINEEQRSKIVSSFNAKKDFENFSRIVSLDEIASKNHDLRPALYVDVVGLDNFLGGKVCLQKISDLGEILVEWPGKNVKYQEGDIPFIKARDLNIPSLSVNDLIKVSLPEALSEHHYTQTGDILIQRAKLDPKACLIGDNLRGVLVSPHLCILRLHDEHKHLAPYIVELINSDIGLSLLSGRFSGTFLPFLQSNDIGAITIPIPEKTTISLIDKIRAAETHFQENINQARTIRKNLFSIKDREEAGERLRFLTTEATVLSESIIQINSLDFQLRNFYPYPIAYSYRTLEEEKEPSQLYERQLRFAEYMLIFLASIGLSLACSVDAFSSQSSEKNYAEVLRQIWSKNVAMGDWQQIAQKCGSLLRDFRDDAIYIQFSSLWYTEGKKKGTEFAKFSRDLVTIRNDKDHHRGPRTRLEYVDTVNDLSKILTNCLERLNVFTQFPIRLIEDINQEWQSEIYKIRTRLFMGDHPIGMRREECVYPSGLSKDKLYIEVTEKKWIPIYPLISIQDCPKCKNIETYFMDHFNPNTGNTRLVSFERGHKLDDTNEARQVGQDFNHRILIMSNNPEQ